MAQRVAHPRSRLRSTRGRLTAEGEVGLETDDEVAALSVAEFSISQEKLMPPLTLEQLHDLTLDRLFTQNRDKGSLTVATSMQIAELRGDVAADAQPKARIDSWWIIRFDVSAINEVRYHLLSESYVTSPVQKVDLARGRLVTLNSLYEIGRKAEGKPTVTALISLAAYFRKAPLGEFFGVPHAWF